MFSDIPSAKKWCRYNPHIPEKPTSTRETTTYCQYGQWKGRACCWLVVRCGCRARQSTTLGSGDAATWCVTGPIVLTIWEFCICTCVDSVSAEEWKKKCSRLSSEHVHEPSGHPSTSSFCETTLHQHFHFKNSPPLPYLDPFDDLPISANCIGLLFVEQHARSGALKSNIDYTK
jgi:hypothetical protein